MSSHSSQKTSDHLKSTYQMKTDLQHILENPDTYIGSIENVESPEYIYENGAIINKTIPINPALFKLFDEGIVNCRDHVLRTSLKKKKGETNIIPVNQIKITIQDNVITMYNNGNGIDIEKHPEYDIWIPELIFGHLRTSTNYNKNEKKITGGKNGFGFKLVLIWSTYGRIETVDHIRGLKYVQTFENNLTKINKPKITKTKVEPYTEISFKPDYHRLGISGLTENMIQLFQRRVYDISGITSKEVKVKYNNEMIKSKDFQSYMQLYFHDQNTKKIYEDINERWSIGIVLSDEYKQVSFVNGIYTSKGGKHVDYIINQITKKMIAYILKKKKVTVKPVAIKEQLFVFINSTIENPAFDSQTKDYLNTPISKFGSICEVSDKMIDKLAKMGVMDTACALSEIKDKKLAKKTDGKLSKSIRGIPKLVDANFAGTSKSSETILILCEGDSAKAGIISGLSNNDRNFIGVYPMKGKLFNVRGETQKKINDSKEITEIKKIIGLETGKTYKNTNSLRYSKIIFMTDQDLDGSHIKGLCINFIAYLWPSLLQIPEFIGFMNTPILKATKVNKSISFYTMGDYEKWKASHKSASGYKIKYYKGLGTSTSKEFKEYFKEKKIVTFMLQDQDNELIDKVFNKTKADERKEWLATYDRNSYLDIQSNQINYDSFINKELIHFSKYDCDRSIPKLMDGLKLSQRKILFSAFKKKLYSEIKVAQFSGYVSEHSGYHHGEASLNGAIVNLAQNYVGSNNINLFVPNGQFGTRLQGGKDSASERYIFTKLNKITRMIFRKEDDAILDYLDDDGTCVEPIYYVPIIPMILVNGSIGIGTGFSTSIPCYNPKEIIQYIKNKINNTEKEIHMIPYYHGFKGTIKQTDDFKYTTYGMVEIKEESIIIKELPIGVWNENYIIFLEKCLETKKDGLKDYKDLSTDKDINIELIFSNDVNLNDQLTINKIIQNFKLTSSLSTSNMYLFDSNEKLIHFKSVYEIMNLFIQIRLDYYNIRKEHQIKEMKNSLILYSNKYKFIQEILNDTLDLRKKKSSEVETMLQNKEYHKIDNSFHYLVKLPMDSVNQENVDRLKKEYDDLKLQLSILQETSITTIYNNELNELEKMI